MKFTQVVALPLLFSAVLAAPTKTFPLQARSTTLTGSFASVVTGAYTVYQNLWGAADATSGSQTLTLDSQTDGTVVWSTSWTWAGGSDDVKSYDNIALTTTGVQISSISSIPTVYQWSYSGSSIVADVSYDLFTASSASGTNEFEIMVWLAALGGAGPISSSGSSIGSTSVGGTTFDLYTGPNGDTTVYSFVATSEATDFSGDLLEFLTYLIDNEGFSSSQYITTLEAGTEPFTGSDAVLSVSAYSVSINASDSTSTSTPSTKVSPISSLAIASSTSTTLIPTTLRKSKSTKAAVATTFTSSSLTAVAAHSASSTKLAASAALTTLLSTSAQPSVTSHSTHRISHHLRLETTILVPS